MERLLIVDTTATLTLRLPAAADERWFAELTTKWLRRGTHRSVPQLKRSIQAWIDTWNDNPRPFVWTKTGDQILDTIAAYCQRINASEHYRGSPVPVTPMAAARQFTGLRGLGTVGRKREHLVSNRPRQAGPDASTKTVEAAHTGRCPQARGGPAAAGTARAWPRRQEPADMKILRRLALLGTAAAAMLLLASCMSIRGDITLDRQAHASGQMSLEVSKQAANFLGISSADDFQFHASQRYGTVKVSETADAYRATGHLVRQLLGDPTGLLASIDPNAHQVRFSIGQLVTAEDTSMPPGTIDLTVRFPGKIISLQGPGISKVDSHTVRINTPLTTDVLSAATAANGIWTVTSTIDPPQPVGPRLLMIIIPVVLVVGGGAVVAWRRSHHHPVPRTPTPG
jgi:hypothetical protein